MVEIVEIVNSFGSYDQDKIKKQLWPRIIMQREYNDQVMVHRKSIPVVPYEPHCGQGQYDRDDGFYSEKERDALVKKTLAEPLDRFGRVRLGKTYDLGTPPDVTTRRPR